MTTLKLTDPQMLVYMVLSVLFSVLNSITFKQLLNQYRSDSVESSSGGGRHLLDASTGHNYSFFVNQFNIVIYILLSLLIILWKRLVSGPEWWSNQHIPYRKFAVMGLLDATAGFLSTIGGAYTDGSLQNLINQSVIPITMLLSILLLRVRYTITQCSGAGAILAGTAVSVIPSMTANTHAKTTTAGLVIFVSGLLPTSGSNVYKEAAFRESKVSVDVYVMSYVVALYQVLFGFLFLPVLALPAFGGVPFSEMPNQMYYGFRCFLSMNSQPGDHCEGPWWSNATTAMFLYCVVNFGYNVFQLLVTKHGSAVLMVVSSALALPVTNLAFSWKFLMGPDAEPFLPNDVVALVIVVIGFIVYSLPYTAPEGDKHGPKAPLLLLQAAGGSMVYTRPRSNSDPSTPRFTTPRSPGSRFGRYSPSMRRFQEQTYANQASPLMIDVRKTSPYQTIPTEEFAEQEMTHPGEEALSNSL